jgi:hypothetical protein
MKQQKSEAFFFYGRQDRAIREADLTRAPPSDVTVLCILLI